MTTIAGELTADGEHIVLVAGGSDVDVAAAARQLKLLTPLISQSDPPGAVTLPATWPAVVQLTHVYGVSWRPGPRLVEWTQEEIRRRNGGAPDLAYTPPDGLTPYPWQLEGAQMIASVGKVLLTDEPGTGKTITAILGIVERGGQDDPVWPVVCVVPASVVDPWVEAWRTWAPARRTVAWRGTPAQRRKLAGTADVYVASYDTARIDAPPEAHSRGGRPLLDLEPGAVVVDECHLIKNQRSLRSLAVRRLTRHADTVVALSGTPITHHPGDLWPTLVALEPAAWPSRERWVDRYCQSVSGDYDEEIIGLHPHREPEFRTTLLGATRRVAKADVLSQLPPKVYSVRTVELPQAWRKIYDDVESKMLAELPDGEELSVMSVLAQLTRLSQLASAAADIAVSTEVDEDGVEHEHVTVTLKRPSWKVDALLEVLAERPGQAVGVFAPSRQLITLAGEAAAKAGYRVGYVVGGQCMTERTETVNAFQSGELDVICCTTGAGGVGLTLTAARTAVFLQRPWSIVEAMQAEDRFHRIGSEQHDSIEIVDVVAARTIDTRVRAVLREKAGQLGDLVQDPRIVTELLGGTPESTPDRKAA
ncbi:helicase-like protein [Haloactinopolyspora alba]|uniref:Helicase-like protein n=1 Tax=Haloactinopolyspora alba TaxID=648780 RepID=A0A2P8DHM1_9ACTN|nr:DEAD/DEAH box helicase [Haloactinopolyspora alba]PSK96679.1 helicase-like protein [Haloactinopolyspora alba]